MRVALYAHPFDLEALRAHGGLARLRDLGIGEVAMATSYHDGRWLMPWHPDGRVRFLEDGTVHFRPLGEYGVLRPKVSSSVPASGPSPLERLCDEAGKVGLGVRAWTVLTHNSRLGAQHPELCVENAFGDRYPYALCPAQPAVQQYVQNLVRDVTGHHGLGTVELEALGWMGWKHSSHHDKASFAPRGLLDYALSLCFCAACQQAMRKEGDPEQTRTWAKAMVTRSLEQADAMQPPAVLERIDVAKWEAKDPETVAAENATLPARAARAQVVASLGRAIRTQLPSGVACAVQVHPADLFTGSQTPVPQTSGLKADEYVITAYGEGPAAIEKLLTGEKMSLLRDRTKRLCIWPKAPQFTSDEDLDKVRDLCAQHGVTSLAIYHLGLLPWRTIERVAKMFAA